MLLVFLLYLLLSLRVTVRLSAGIGAQQSAVSASVGALGLWVRYEGVIVLEGAKPHVQPRYGSKKRKGKKLKQRLDRCKRLWPWLRALVPCLDFARCDLLLRIGLGQADETAVAAGALRAAISALAASLPAAPPLRLHVQADFERPAFLGVGHCIFSFALGDIMFAAARFALRKTRREGFGWISIPLRA